MSCLFFFDFFLLKLDLLFFSVALYSIGGAIPGLFIGFKVSRGQSWKERSSWLKFLPEMDYICVENRI